MLPEAKLDILLAHHAALENELLGQVNSDRYVQITRELADLNPLIDAVKSYRGVLAELAGTEALLADPATDAEMRGMAETERDELQARRDELEQEIRVALFWDESAEATVRQLGHRRIQSDAELQQLIKEAHDDHVRLRKPDTPVIIDADRRVPWHEVVNVLNISKRDQIEKVEFALGARTK